VLGSFVLNAGRWIPRRRHIDIALAGDDPRCAASARVVSPASRRSGSTVMPGKLTGKLTARNAICRAMFIAGRAFRIRAKP